MRALRTAGHDVLSVRELSPGASDKQVLGIAVDEERVLITEDKDFGEWVFGRAHSSSGVVMIRFPAGSRAGLPDAILRLVTEKGAILRGAFTVLEPGRARIRKR